ncbi:MAG: hypothetical protein KF910_08235 [Brevundimonas sp.]|uniref:hypothetical protein n=1 Tax=Brevundimonas sp. TaxID=1871086 RepID=UPI0025BEBF9B|nr:hypothetical protein [Brevundimonas sp.]MBX3477583.1 hypothetical protein [Brevundimonas sp.]
MSGLDPLAMAFGRRLPRPVNIVVNLVWWPVFLLTATSLNAALYARLEGYAAQAWGIHRLPTYFELFPVMFLLVGAQTLHGMAIKRRDELSPPVIRNNPFR